MAIVFCSDGTSNVQVNVCVAPSLAGIPGKRVAISEIKVPAATCTLALTQGNKLYTTLHKINLPIKNGQIDMTGTKKTFCVDCSYSGSVVVPVCTTCGTYASAICSATCTTNNSVIATPCNCTTKSNKTSCCTMGSGLQCGNGSMTLVCSGFQTTNGGGGGGGCSSGYYPTIGGGGTTTLGGSTNYSTTATTYELIGTVKAEEPMDWLLQASGLHDVLTEAKETYVGNPLIPEDLQAEIQTNFDNLEKDMQDVGNTLHADVKAQFPEATFIYLDYQDNCIKVYKDSEQTKTTDTE